MPCQKIQIQKKYYWWVFKEIIMNIDTPLVEVMVDGFLQEVF